MERREFIKATCSLCVLLSPGVLLETLSSCAAYPVYKTDMAQSRIVVPISAFDKTDLQIIRTGNFNYDIALRKINNENYTALLLRCTHASNPLKYAGKEFVCPLHGSTYNMDGNVMEGPATKSLREMDIMLSNNKITILINY
jgi:Rieske Fe-S protein